MERSKKNNITFVEESHPHDNDSRDFSTKTRGLDFLENPKEDIYQDYLNHKPGAK